MDLVQIQKKLNSENTFVYLANDVYQGTGPEFFLENYHIVTFDYNPLTRLVRNNTKVFTLEEATNVKNKTFRNSSNLADFSCVVDYVNSLYGNKKVLTFKNSAHLKSCAINNKWEICASNPELGRYFENKLKSGKYFEELSLNVPAYKIIKAGKDSINYKSISREFGEKFVIQLAKGFGGAHTYIISSETDIQDILPRISEREVKISKFIEGLTITINACVTSTKVIAAHPFLQITGIEECIKNKSGATGNQWGDLPCPNDLIIKSTSSGQQSIFY
ncbi:hypothetical protein HY745_04510 [Candidatus Desantisbacteria bacterium]|nr:hypothetical protein [Candidatus Desantisbacteria bacterium]